MQAFGDDALEGAVLAETDPPYRDVQVPLEFWKVFVYQRDNEVGGAGGRRHTVAGRVEEPRPVLRSFVVYEKTFDEIARKAKVTFDATLQDLQYRGWPRSRAQSRRVEHKSDITW